MLMFIEVKKDILSEIKKYNKDMEVKKKAHLKETLSDLFNLMSYKSMTEEEKEKATVKRKDDDSITVETMPDKEGADKLVEEALS